MKKIILLTAFILSFLTSFAQKQICGIYWGASYDTAKTTLEQKFGTRDGTSDNNNIVFRYKRYAGISFTYMCFSFQRESLHSYLNSCVMGFECKTVEEAKSKRDYIASVVGNQYALNNAIGADGFKYYYGGTSPTNVAEFGFSIDVVKLSETTPEGYNYFARIIYGPYNFIKEEF